MQFPLWLRSSVVGACDQNSQDPGFDSRWGCAVFFCLIQLSVLLSLSELKEKRMMPTRVSLRLYCIVRVVVACVIRENTAVMFRANAEIY